MFKHRGIKAVVILSLIRKLQTRYTGEAEAVLGLQRTKWIMILLSFLLGGLESMGQAEARARCEQLHVVNC